MIVEKEDEVEEEAEKEEDEVEEGIEEEDEVEEVKKVGEERIFLGLGCHNNSYCRRCIL